MMRRFHPTSRALQRTVALLLLAFFVVQFGAGVAAACPTCKDNLAHDPASASLARGFYYSILFMVSMPFVIFGSLTAYFYWEVRKAKARQAADALVSAATKPELAL